MFQIFSNTNPNKAGIFKNSFSGGGQFDPPGGPPALYVNSGCLKCISGMNLSPASKILFVISFVIT